MDAFLVIDDEFLGQDVQDLLVGRDRDGTRRVDHALDIAVRHLAILDRDDAVRVQARHMAAGNTGVDRIDLDTGHQFGLFDRTLDRLHGRFDVDHDAPFLGRAKDAADADDLDLVVVH